MDLLYRCVTGCKYKNVEIQETFRNKTAGENGENFGFERILLYVNKVLLDLQI